MTDLQKWNTLWLQERVRELELEVESLKKKTNICAKCGKEEGSNEACAN